MADQDCNTPEPDSYIYCLRDPDTNEIRYVGRSRTPADRLRRHIRDSGHDGTGVSVWLRSLQGRRPKLEIMERCSDSSANERERYWINHLGVGNRLVNSHAAGPRELTSSDDVRTRRQEFCRNGHALTPDNLRIRPDRRNCVECKVCQKEGRRRFNGRRPLYNIWKTMIRRTTDPTFKDWSRYGGKVPPVTVCERWLRSYEDFQADVGPRPSKRHTLDRICGDGGYSPDNCRWATPKEQAQNTARNRFVTHDGLTLCIRDWARRLNVLPGSLYVRLHRGMSPEEAVSRPFRSDQRSKTPLRKPSSPSIRGRGAA